MSHMDEQALCNQILKAIAEATGIPEDQLVVYPTGASLGEVTGDGPVEIKVHVKGMHHGNQLPDGNGDPVMPDHLHGSGAG